MNNKRKGKYQTKDTSHNDMKIIKSLKLASQVLQDAGHEDPSFYFEQFTDYMSSGKPLPLAEQEKIRALGV